MTTPPESFAPPPYPVEPLTVVTTSDERLWAMLAHLCGIFGYTGGVLQYVGPLVVYLIYKDRSRFVAFHALQTLYFHLGVTVALVVCGVLGFLTCGLTVPLMAVIAVGALVYSIYGAVQAHDGKLFEYWLVGRWARDQVRI